MVQGLPWRAATVPRGRVARASARLDGIGVRSLGFRVQGVSTHRAGLLVRVQRLGKGDLGVKV